MTDKKNTAARENLARIAGLLRPALASKDYIPALMHIRFADGTADAYNDVTAISVRAEVPIEACVPGALLVQALVSFGGAEVLFQDAKKGAGLTLKSGRAQVTLPTLPVEDFPLEWPAANEGEELPLTDQMVKAVERCLVSVGNDPDHPAQMGVTLDFDDTGRAIFYSTDNYTVSRCWTDTKIKLPGDAPVILPRFFCEQLVSLAKAFNGPERCLILHDGALEVLFFTDESELPAARLLSKTPVDMEPLDFPRIVAKHVKLDGIKKRMSVIPDAFDAALGRALLVLGGEVAKTTTATIKKGCISLRSASSLGDADDEIEWTGGGPDKPFDFDPAMVSRGAKVTALVEFTDKVTVFADADAVFIHLVAHVAA